MVIEIWQGDKKTKTLQNGRTSDEYSDPEGHHFYLRGEKKGGLYRHWYIPGETKSLLPGETLELADDKIAKGV